MAVRWVCPECGKGVNAPSRMNAMDTRRFCLSCSAGAPRLVERQAPSLQRKRSAAKAKQAERSRERRESLMSAKNRSRSVRLRSGELVRVDHLVRQAWALPIRRAEASGASLPEIVVRQGEKPHSTGRCFPGEKLVFTAGRNPDLAEVHAIVLHEVAHELAYQVKGNCAHDTAFWSYFRGLLGEWTGVPGPAFDGDRYERHDMAVAFLRRELTE